MTDVDSTLVPAQAASDPFLEALRREIGLWRSEAIFWQIQAVTSRQEAEALQSELISIRQELEKGVDHANGN